MAKKDMSIITKGFLETQSGFSAASSYGESAIGGLGGLLSSIGLGGIV